MSHRASIAAAATLLAALAVAQPAAAGPWVIEPGMGAYCTAEAKVDETRTVLMQATPAELSFAIRSEKRIPRGHMGVVEMGNYIFPFLPGYNGGRYLFAQSPFDGQAVETLRTATGMRVSVDGQEVIDVGLRDSGLSEVMDALVQCARGGEGWWGKGSTLALN